MNTTVNTSKPSEDCAVVALYLDGDYFTGDSPTFLDSYYNFAYHDLISRLLKRNVRVIISRDYDNNYIPDFKFKNYWIAKDNNSKIVFEKITAGVIEFHTLLDKGSFPLDIPRKVNSNSLRAICRDKYLSYLFAPDLHPQSFLLRDDFDLKVFSSRSTENIVLKSLLGHGGKQVFVGKFSEYKNNLAFPLFAQNFIDTSGGAPNGLVDGIHDVRVRVFDGRILGGSVRWPAVSGELRSNLALGGNFRALYSSEIPVDLIDKTLDIAQKFELKQSYFICADWGFDKATNGWKLFEINDSPGLGHTGADGTAANEYIDLLAENLAKNANDNYRSATPIA